MTNSDVRPWERVYGLRPDPLSQYQLLLDKKQTAQIRLDFEDVLVPKPPGVLGLMVDAGAKGIEVGHDGLGHLSIDRIEPDRARLRPLSYLLHNRCFRALDVPQTLAFGDSDKHATLRRRLTKFGSPHPPDSDLFPCKVGMTSLIVEGRPGAVRAILTTRRAAGLAIYGGQRHCSFSGGAERSELTGKDQRWLIFWPWPQCANARRSCT